MKGTQVNYNLSEISFPSSDGIHTVYALVYTPKHKSSKGIVQLAHGMIDHVQRYEELADYLTGEGYIFAGHYHLGHGKTANKDEDYGFFAERGGVDFLIRDMHAMNKYLRTSFPALPIVLFGHSMGSFITRLYLVKHPHSVSGAVIHGTAGPNAAVGMGKALAGIISKLRGPRHRSKLIDKLAFGTYNSKFPKDEGPNAWLTREVSLVADKGKDSYTDFIFTVSAFSDLFTMLRDSNRKEWFKNYPKSMPTLIMSGGADPVGNYGKGPMYVYKQLLMSKCENLQIKMYEGARHELFNETNRQDVFADLTEWLNGNIHNLF